MGKEGGPKEHSAVGGCGRPLPVLFIILHTTVHMATPRHRDNDGVDLLFSLVFSEHVPRKPTRPRSFRAFVAAVAPYPSCKNQLNEAQKEAQTFISRSSVQIRPL